MLGITDLKAKIILSEEKKGKKGGKVQKKMKKGRKSSSHNYSYL